MRTYDIGILTENLGEEISTSFIKEDNEKLRSFVNFISIVSGKNIFSKKYIENFAVKYRDGIYGETFLDMLIILNASEVEISYGECIYLCQNYILLCTSDEKEYRNMLEDIKTVYGDCNGFFSEEYIESKIVKEKERHFSTSIEELIEKGYTIDDIKILLEKRGIKEFNPDTRIYVNNL